MRYKSVEESLFLRVELFQQALRLFEVQSFFSAQVFCYRPGGAFVKPGLHTSHAVGEEVRRDFFQLARKFHVPVLLAEAVDLFRKVAHSVSLVFLSMPQLRGPSYGRFFVIKLSFRFRSLQKYRVCPGLSAVHIDAFGADVGFTSFQFVFAAGEFVGKGAAHDSRAVADFAARDEVYSAYAGALDEGAAVPHSPVVDFGARRGVEISREQAFYYRVVRQLGRAHRHPAAAGVVEDSFVVVVVGRCAPDSASRAQHDVPVRRVEARAAFVLRVIVEYFEREDASLARELVFGDARPYGVVVHRDEAHAAHAIDHVAQHRRAVPLLEVDALRQDLEMLGQRLARFAHHARGAEQRVDVVDLDALLEAEVLVEHRRGLVARYYDEVVAVEVVAVVAVAVVVGEGEEAVAVVSEHTHRLGGRQMPVGVRRVAVQVALVPVPALGEAANVFHRSTALCSSCPLS